MKIVFMGTPDFAAVSLNALLNTDYNIAAVFTNPDKPSGRGQRLVSPPVKLLAEQNNIKVYQPKSLKNPELLSILSDIAPDVIVVVAYGKILPQAILSLPPLGCVNVHGSILPKYRGAAPIQHSVLNGDKETGITTMLMDDGIDTGDILLLEKTPIGENETSSELFDRLAIMGGELLLKTLQGLSKGELTSQKQDEEKATYAPMLSKEMSIIDFGKSASDVHRLICGLSDWPCAVAYLDGKRIKIYKSEIYTLPQEFLELPCGHICQDKNSFIVVCGGKTAVRLLSVQYEGSKRMDGGAFLRGRRLEENPRLLSTPQG